MKKTIMMQNRMMCMCQGTKLCCGMCCCAKNRRCSMDKK